MCRAPRRAFGAITGYDVKFFIPNTSQNIVISKDRDVFFHLVTDSDTLPGPGDIYVIGVGTGGGEGGTCPQCPPPIF